MLSSFAPTAVTPPEGAAAPAEPFRSLQIATASTAGAKKKRRPAGTPDPDAEVVSLSPRTLLESDRYVCEICGQGFQRDQNLQMHRRRHKVPWKLLKREAGEAARKRVFVCPEPSCLHHDPSHALGDLVGIKKHFRRKHSGHRQWACARCSKAYAVHSDYKAHLKTCGTRGHTCDCGRVFSRVESFIEHQDTCNAARPRAETSSSPASGGGGAAGASTSQQQRQLHAAAALSRTASSASPSSGGDLVASPAAWPGPAMASPTAAAAYHRFDPAALSPLTLSDRAGVHNLELQLMPPRGSCAGGGAASAAVGRCASPHSPDAVPSLGADPMRLQLSIGFGGPREDNVLAPSAAAATKLKDEAREQLRLAMAEKAAADEAQAHARRLAELAEQELASARRMRQQAQVELGRAHALRDHAVRQVDATLLQVTCYSCRHKFRARAAAMSSEVASYVSSVVTEGGDAEVDNDEHHQLNADDVPSHARKDIN
ncbi:protein indeterminate-domain 16-like [Phragmites australis]|uniref:protein indeterminate-domain 16-like n=1 Tax=Phragmites australis TaxID=29695 RepID=UPI002D79C34E|nr:protein indeterminate-domain 16-like [Phragmites australis]